MNKSLIVALISFGLGLSGFAMVYLVYNPRADELRQEMEKLEAQLAALKSRLKQLQEQYEASDQPRIYADNGSQIMYDVWFTVNSTSMSPTLMIDDVVYVQARTNASVINVNDIIAFFNPNAWSTITIHRVVEKRLTDNDVLFFTQGDNQSLRDPWPIPELNVIGKVAAYSRGSLIGVFE